jgi:hypothetical protein
MKTIKNLNTLAIFLPFIILITYPIYEEVSIFYALYSTMITGFIQVILGLTMIIKEPKNKFLIAYLLSVIIFFLLWYYNIKINYSDNLSVFLFTIPPSLAIYLSVVIYKATKP